MKRRRKVSEGHQGGWSKGDTGNRKEGRVRRGMKAGGTRRRLRKARGRREDGKVEV